MAPSEEKESKEDEEDKQQREEDDEEDEPIVKELKQLDDEYLKLEREFEAEERALRLKFLQRQEPLLKQRAEMLQDASAAGDEAEKSIGTPALKGFWIHALRNHPAFKTDEQVLQEWDEPVLDYLKDVSSAVVDENEHRCFRLDFAFAENPYFEETLLSKTYTAKESCPWNGESEVKEIKSTPITWKPGKDITVETVKKKVKGGGAKKVKQAKEKIQPRLSFFRTFLGLSVVEGGSIPEGCECLAEEIKRQTCEDGDDDLEDDESIIGFIMERDYELGMAIKDNIIPFAVRWYTGEACPIIDLDDDDEDEEEEEEDDDEDDDDDSEEEEKPSSKAKSKAKAKAAGGKKTEECKQQ